MKLRLKVSSCQSHSFSARQAKCGVLENISNEWINSFVKETRKHQSERIMSTVMDTRSILPASRFFTLQCPKCQNRNYSESGSDRKYSVGDYHLGGRCSKCGQTSGKNVAEIFETPKDKAVLAGV
jgi:DNA-directed RNA polymerase subunit M/transcription elongation factor TFIIS